MSIVGAPRDVFASLDVLKAKASRLLLELQTEKSRAYAKQAVLEAHQSEVINGFKKSSKGLIVVGTPVCTGVTYAPQEHHKGVNLSYYCRYK